MLPITRSYDFVTDYHERQPHNPAANITGGRPISAVLDGQQRLTALNIALRVRTPRSYLGCGRDNPAAYPKKRLHLDITRLNYDPGQELEYYFEFLTDNEVESR